MIVKKPYAFLIKNFRIIHGFLFLFLLYVGKQTLDIYDFYRDYLVFHSYNSTLDLVKEYISIGMFFFTILIIGISAVIFFILALKNKPKKLYVYIMITYIALIGYYIFMFFGFNSLQGSSFNVETQRMYRDIAFMALFPQGIAIAVVFLRTIGFNLREFNFKRDLEDMNIEVSDSEEVELNIGSDSYKYARSFRKLLRITKYFILENKMFVIILSSIAILVISIITFNKINIYRNKVYERAAFQANNVTYDIKEAYITQRDINYSIINEDKYYILVKIAMHNKTMNDANLNRDTFRLQLRDRMIHPNLTIYKKFMDLGNIFKSKILKSGVSEENYVIFEIDKTDLASEYIIKIASTAANTNDNSGYKEAIIKPSDLDKLNDNGSKTLPNTMSFEGSLLNKTYYNIESYAIAERYKEEYMYDFQGVSKTGVYTIVPDKTSAGDTIILKINSTAKIDTEAYISSFINNQADLYDYYGFISFRALGKTYTYKLKSMNVSFEPEKHTYFEVPSNISNADRIELLFLIRGQKYTFILQ